MAKGERMKFRATLNKISADKDGEWTVILKAPETEKLTMVQLAVCTQLELEVSIETELIDDWGRNGSGDSDTEGEGVPGA
jgi:hypothetical protein